MIEIRIATVADAELIADISRETFYDSFASYNTKEDMDIFMNEVFTKEALMKEAGTEGNIFLLAYDGNEAVGYVRMREGEKHKELNGKSSFEIARIYAVKKAIGRGVGRALMQKSFEIAAGLKKEVVWLGVWEKNERAIAFYTEWGFVKFGEHDFILGKDVQTDWLMKKELATTYLPTPSFELKD